MKQNILDTIDNFEEELFKVSDKINEENKTMFHFYELIWSEEMNLINMNYVFYYGGIIGFPNEFTNDIFSLAYKNLISIYSCIQLIKKGLPGSAKIIFRNIYENLLIAKYFSVSKDMKNFNKWKNGEQLSIKSKIFSSIQNETSKESIEFWDMLNKYTHGTVYAQDFSLDYNKTIIEECNCFISVLLEMNYHLLNIHISKDCEYYLNRYNEEKYKACKKNLKDGFIASKRLLDPRCKKVIKDYIAKWNLS